MLRFLLLLLLLFAPAAYAQVNLNTATSEQLQTLPGIGPSKAAAIIEHRKTAGPFEKIDDLDLVPGIGPATVENLRSLVTVTKGAGGAAPASASAPAPSGSRVNINTADAKSLEGLPGIGPTKAQAILDDRAANGPFASCDDLARVKGIGVATVSGIRDLCAVK